MQENKASKYLNVHGIPEELFYQFKMRVHSQRKTMHEVLIQFMESYVKTVPAGNSKVRGTGTSFDNSGTNGRLDKVEATLQRAVDFISKLEGKGKPPELDKFGNPLHPVVHSIGEKTPAKPVKKKTASSGKTKEIIKPSLPSRLILKPDEPLIVDDFEAKFLRKYPNYPVPTEEELNNFPEDSDEIVFESEVRRLQCCVCKAVLRGRNNLGSHFQEAHGWDVDKALESAWGGLTEVKKSPKTSNGNPGSEKEEKNEAGVFGIPWW